MGWIPIILAVVFGYVYYRWQDGLSLPPDQPFQDDWKSYDLPPTFHKLLRIIRPPLFSKDPVIIQSEFGPIATIERPSPGHLIVRDITGRAILWSEVTGPLVGVIPPLAYNIHGASGEIGEYRCTSVFHGRNDNINFAGIQVAVYRRGRTSCIAFDKTEVARVCLVRGISAGPGGLVLLVDLPENLNALCYWLGYRLTQART